MSNMIIDMIIFIAFFIVLDECVIKSLIKYLYEMKRSYIYEEAVVNSNLQEEIEAVSAYIEYIIGEALAEYQAFNPSIFLNKEYLTSADEDIIRDSVLESVKKRLSPHILKYVAIYYKIDSIDEMIANKIYLQTTKFVLDYNEGSVTEE